MATLKPIVPTQAIGTGVLGTASQSGPRTHRCHRLPDRLRGPAAHELRAHRAPLPVGNTCTGFREPQDEHRRAALPRTAYTKTRRRPHSTTHPAQPTSHPQLRGTSALTPATAPVQPPLPSHRPALQHCQVRMRPGERSFPFTPRFRMRSEPQNSLEVRRGRGNAHAEQIVWLAHAPQA